MDAETARTVKSIADALRLARAIRQYGLTCWGPADGWCGRVHTTVLQAHQCQGVISLAADAPPGSDRRTYSVQSDPAAATDKALRRDDVLAELDRRDRALRVTMPGDEPAEREGEP